MIYVDEDCVNAEGVRFDPKFKPDFNLDGLRAMPYLGRFCLVRREAVEAVGGYAPYWGMAYYDMAFKIVEQYGEGAMGHLAQLLFHRFDVNELSDRGLLSKWRAKINASADFGKEIVAQHLKRQGIQAAVYETDFPDCYWIDYPVHYPAFVSIIIATRNSGQALQRCLLSLFQHTHYEQYEIIVVDNDSDNLATLHYLETLKTDKRIQILVWTPQVTLIQHGLGSLVRHRGRAIQKRQVENEIAVIYQKWLPTVCNEPAYNPHLALTGKEWEPEIEIMVPWDVNLKRAADEPPRIVAFPYNAWASGEYRVRAPLSALHEAGVAHYALMPNDEAHRVPTLTELERMQPDTLLLHNTFK